MEAAWPMVYVKSVRGNSFNSEVRVRCTWSHKVTIFLPVFIYLFSNFMSIFFFFSCLSKPIVHAYVIPIHFPYIVACYYQLQLWGECERGRNSNNWLIATENKLNPFNICHSPPIEDISNTRCMDKCGGGCIVPGLGNLSLDQKWLSTSSQHDLLI